MNLRPTRALIFDLGGVLIEFDFKRAFSAWKDISRLSLEELQRSFRFDEMYEQHERGEITASRYFAHLRDKLALADDLDRIAQGWNAIFSAEIGPTLRLIAAVRANIPCYAFTNTNQSHQETWMRMFPAVATSFEKVFASHEIGLRKPELRAFAYIANELDLPVDELLFFDDLQENVDGAKAAGLQAVLVRTPEDVRNALEAIGYRLTLPA